ncbi:hypothetical protein [Flavivirga eckloniae]|uniref:SbsA Ig-like domain-containing protein n=1 Tax=Flavivirga eckloniae TaxID=1803846 RepID=A0A2K9PT11_9FLAO|nr:hypothetical protein [Flavivirga eckloniae]AUP80179.1 hypothetical protein C1H87_16270 [Flavivirga eckloniae]
MNNKYLCIILIVLGLLGSCTNDDDGAPNAPKVLTVSVSPAANQENPTDVDSAEFTVVFSEAIDPTTFTADVINLNNTTGTVSTGPSSTDNITWSFIVTGMTNGDAVAASIPAGVVTNMAGDSNKASFFTNKTVTFSKVAISIDQATNQRDPTNIDSAEFTVVFSEAIDPATFTVDDITISGTTGTITTGPTSTDNITWNFIVTGMTDNDIVVATIDEDTVTTVDGTINEASTSTDNMITYDSTLIFTVEVTIDQAASQADPTDIDSIEFTVVFNEAIDAATFTADDITLSGTTGTVTTGPTSTDNIAWSFTVTGMTELDKVTATLAANTVANSVGTANEASTSTDNEVRYTTDLACGVNAYVWDGTLSNDAGATNQFPSGDPFDVTGTVTSCGALTISSTVEVDYVDLDVSLFFCEAGVQTLDLVLTPDSDGATNGTVTVVRQTYENCSSFSTLEVEGGGTYDETTGIITLTVIQFFDGFSGDPVTIIISTK